jgi:hypothetical protein
MLAGRPLLAESDFLSILEYHARWSLPPADAIRPELSGDLYTVLRESLAKDPDERVLNLGRLSRRWRTAGRSKKLPATVSAESPV